MATYNATGSTPNCNFPLFEDNDKPSWLVDWNGTVTELDTVLAKLKSNVDTNKNLIDATNSNVSKIETEISKIETDLTVITNRVVKLEGSTTELEAQYNAILLDLQAQNKLILDLQSRVVRLESISSENSSSITGLKKDTELNTTSISTLTEEVENLDSAVQLNTSSIEVLTPKVAKNTSDITNLTSTVESQKISICDSTVSQGVKNESNLTLTEISNGYTREKMYVIADIIYDPVGAERNAYGSHAFSISLPTSKPTSDKVLGQFDCDKFDIGGTMQDGVLEVRYNSTTDTVGVFYKAIGATTTNKEWWCPAIFIC